MKGQKGETENGFRNGSTKKWGAKHRESMVN